MNPLSGLRGTRSTSSPLCVALGSPPCLSAIQVAVLLDMARVSRNDGIGHTQKTLRNDSGNFKAIKVLVPHLPQNSLQCVLDTLRSHSTKAHHLYFCRHEKEVPSCSMDLAIKGETI